MLKLFYLLVVLVWGGILAGVEGDNEMSNEVVVDHLTNSNNYVEPLTPSFTKPLYMRSVSQKLFPQGSDAILTCHAEGFAPIQYTWLDSEGREVARKRRFRFAHNRSMLKIKRLRESESGSYTCVASNVYGNLSFTYQLTVKGSDTKRPSFPDEQQMERKKRNLRATEQSIKLPCRAQSKHSVQYVWYHGSTPIKHISSESVDENNNNNNVTYGDLDINKLKVHDAGLYTCVAVNKFGNATFTYELRIIWKHAIGLPKVIPYTRPQNLMARRGENVTLDVLEIFSAMIPHVRWLHMFNADEPDTLPDIPNDFRLEDLDKTMRLSFDYISAERYEVFQLERTYRKPQIPYVYDDTEPYGLRLVLRNVRVEDTGVYAVSVSNLEGSDFAMFSVTVVDA